MKFPDTLVEEETRVSFLYPALDELTTGVFVELGTYLGGNLTRCIDYARNKDIQFFGVDNYKFDNISNEAKATIGDFPTYYDAFMQGLKDTDTLDKVKVINSDTEQAAALFDDESIDVLFIDDDHNYPHTLRILELWLPKVKTGGWIGGHDCPHHDVRRAVVEMFDGDWKDNHHSWWRRA